MGVQEGDYLAADMLGTQEAGPDQARTFLCAQHKRLDWQLGHILLQLFAQEVCRIIYSIDTKLIENKASPLF